MYYEAMLADTVAISVGYLVAVFFVPGTAGLVLGAGIAVAVAKRQSEKLGRLWYFPVMYATACLAPALIVTFLVGLGPT